VHCEGEGHLQLSSFPDMSQNKGVWAVGGTAVRRARRGVCAWGRSPQGSCLLYVQFKQKGLGKGAASRTSAMVKPRPCKFKGA